LLKLRAKEENAGFQLKPLIPDKVYWYQWRWRIEQLFAILKQPGLDIEATQLESGQAIQSLCVLALSAAVRVLQLVEGRDDATQPASLVFPLDQQQCLVQVAPLYKDALANSKIHIRCSRWLGQLGALPV
jgi:hypothetical protein